MITLKKIKVVDSVTNNGLENVNVFISDQNGNQQKVNGEDIGRTTDSKGLLSVMPVAKESLFVTFSMVGYKPLTLPAISAQNKNGKTVKMIQDTNIIEDIDIFSSVPRPRAKGGKSSQAISKKENKPNNKFMIIGVVVGLVVIAGVVYYFVKHKK